MTCPKCQATLFITSYEGMAVDQCVACRGVWLNEGELSPILCNNQITIPESLAKLVAEQAKPGIPELEISSVELCPQCSSKLNPLNYNYASGIIIDVCPNKHGIWFDSGELDKVQAHFEVWQAKTKADGQTWGVLSSAMNSNAQKAHEDRIMRDKEKSGGLFHFLFRGLAKDLLS